jgi:acyl-coenzyme A thioesterase PaaI-like protein
MNLKSFDLKNVDLKKVDLIKLSEKVPARFRLKALAKALDLAIPFNMGLKMQIEKLSPAEVIVVSPEVRKRRNHVGSAHAAFLVLLSEYPAGLIVAQHYGFDKHRIILAELGIEYFKQGRGRLQSTARAPEQFPELQDGETFLDMITEVKNTQSELVARCRTRWQIKDWSKVRSKKTTN